MAPASPLWPQDAQLIPPGYKAQLGFRGQLLDPLHPPSVEVSKTSLRLPRQDRA